MLGFILWQGEFERRSDLWLRWCDQEGNILLTGDEKAAQAEIKANQAEIKANQAEIKAQKLAEQLRACCFINY